MVHKFLDGEKVDLVRNKTLEGKPQLVKAVCGGAKMKYGVKSPSAQHFTIKDMITKTTSRGIRQIMWS